MTPITIPTGNDDVIFAEHAGVFTWPMQPYHAGALQRLISNTSIMPTIANIQANVCLKFAITVTETGDVSHSVFTVPNDREKTKHVLDFTDLEKSSESAGFVGRVIRSGVVSLVVLNLRSL